MGNYSSVCIYWTASCLRIHFYSFESYWVVLSKYEKIMASLPFIFCCCKHIFLMIIQKEFCFLFDCHNLLKNNPINTNRSQDLFQHTLNISCLFFSENLAMWRQMGWMMLHDAFFLKNCWRQQKYHMKGVLRNRVKAVTQLFCLIL